MKLQLFFLFIQSFSIALIVLLACTAFRIRHAHFYRWLFILLCLSAICYHLRTRYEYNYWIPEVFQFDLGLLSIPSKILMNAYSPIFMVFVHTLMREGKLPPKWLLGLCALQVGLEVVVQWLHPQLINAETPILVKSLVQFSGALQIIFAVMVIYWVLVDWQADLVEARRRLRLVVLLYRGIWSVILVLMYRVVLPQEQYIAFQAHVVVISINAIFLLALTIALLRLDEASLISSPDNRPSKKLPGEKESGEAELDRDWEIFNQAFNEEAVYRDPELNVASLAKQLKIPQYRLRQLIVQKLGYRNFNALLHEFRLKAACRDLKDGDKQHLPILTIALDVGYRSINPFNAAFRQRYGQTPSEYRKNPQPQVAECQ